MTVGDFQHALKEFDLQQEEVHQSSALVTITKPSTQQKMASTNQGCDSIFNYLSNNSIEWNFN